MSDYHWPCRVLVDEDGSYRVSPAGLVGCDGIGRTQDEAADQAREALQRYVSETRIQSLTAIGIYFHTDMLGVLEGDIIRLKIDLP